ncbi:ABC transporter substrate-binding protein [Vagococcus fluvialis]|uniref:ABC transporter substrate-binding protein n=1 Tax=Vagococcus fluvialis TaxID=2738 RepID=UPI001A8CDBA6|nr:ABC transporter substrate-binding protein [Vagococcus fluvialis]MBO0428535.1 ABC transporter substrate-binding protein [Vagococcus fluvialis]
MWKKFLSLFGLGLIAFLIVGCKSQTQETNKESEAKVIKTEMGDVEVPTNPEKVLVNWYVQDVVSLDVIPVGFAGWAQEAMPLYNKMKDIPVVEKWEKEELLSYEPDLIITYDKEDFEKFSKIAPVVVIPESKTPEERLLFLGDVLGKEDQAKELVKTFEDKLEAAKTTFDKEEFKGKTFSIFEDWGSGSFGVGYETESRGGTLLYNKLGLTYPEKLKELIETSGEARKGLSYEVAADYFGDYVIWFLQPEVKESEFQKTKIWPTIPAVKDGKILIVPGELNGLFYYSDVASLIGQLDYFTENFDSLIKK